jgi:hypothetical protein
VEPEGIATANVLTGRATQERGYLSAYSGSTIAKGAAISSAMDAAQAMASSF